MHFFFLVISTSKTGVGLPSDHINISHTCISSANLNVPSASLAFSQYTKHFPHLRGATIHVIHQRCIFERICQFCKYLPWYLFILPWPYPSSLSVSEYHHSCTKLVAQSGMIDGSSYSIFSPTGVSIPWWISGVNLMNQSRTCFFFSYIKALYSGIEILFGLSTNCD